jgi:phosphoribosylamine--glycine ligase
VKVLVIGSGGREHALCWRLAQSPELERLYCAPGNPGTARVGQNVPIEVDALDQLVHFAEEEGIDLTVVGPEAPLCAGIEGRFAARGLRLCGPSPEAARLEGSKAFCKEFMQSNGIPTAPFGVFDDYEAAARYIDGHEAARVVKADGLAAGKGVFVTHDAQAAKQAARQLLDGAMGQAGRRIVVEHKLVGEEVSVIALADGERVVTLASSQDHKPVFDGDQGPNTGGMGAYSPAPVLSPKLARVVNDHVLLRTVEAMAAGGCPYRGVLYAGLMVVNGEPLVLEFNCRFGDPETQPLMMRLASDLLPLLDGAATGTLTGSVEWDARSALCVVMAAEGYPGSYAKGRLINGADDADSDDVVVFHAGTSRGEDGQLLTTGGRVLGVTALGKDLLAAQRRAYERVADIRWDGVHYRRDIGHRGIGR